MVVEPVENEIILKKRTYLAFFVLGAGLELPYNTFLTAYDFFHVAILSLTYRQLLFPDRAIGFTITIAFDPTAVTSLDIHAIRFFF
jgi:hypothetical protein